MTPALRFVHEQRIASGRTRAVLAELARQGLPVLVTARTYGREQHPLPDVLVSPDPSVPGRWRATRFDGDVPDGHEEAPTLYAGLVLAHRPGCLLTQVTAESATVPKHHPDERGACDPEAACEECATAYGREDMAEGAEKAREDEAA